MSAKKQSASPKGDAKAETPAPTTFEERMLAMMADLKRQSDEVKKEMQETLATMAENTADSLREMQNEIRILENEKTAESMPAAHPSVTTRRSSTLDNRGFGPEPYAESLILRQTEKIPPEQMIKTLSIPGLILALHFQAQFQHHFKQFMALVMWLDLKKILRILIQNEQRRGSPGASLLTEGTVYNVDDKAIILMFMNKIRDSKMFTATSFAETILESISMLKPKRDGALFVTPHFDTIFDQPLSKLLVDIGKVMHLVLEGATTEQMAQWPKDGWGTKEVWGKNQVILQTFGGYAENITTCIGIDNLKRMKNHLELIKEIKAFKDDMTNAAIELQRRDARADPMPDLSKLAQRVQHESASTCGGPHVGSHPRSPASKSNRFSEESRVAPYTRQPFFEEEGPIDESLSPEAFHERRDDNARRSYPSSLDVSHGSVEECYDANEYDNSREVISHGRGDATSGSTVPFDSRARKPSSATKPCYKFFYDDKCDCGFPHSAEDMYDLRDHLVSKLLNSKWVKHDWLVHQVTKSPQHR